MAGVAVEADEDWLFGVIVAKAFLVDLQRIKFGVLSFSGFAFVKQKLLSGLELIESPLASTHSKA
jgi:hypothetical protein